MFDYCLIIIMFDHLLFALWFDHLLFDHLLALLFDHLLFDATEQGCAKKFIYDKIPFWLSDMLQCEGA